MTPINSHVSLLYESANFITIIIQKTLVCIQGMASIILLIQYTRSRRVLNFL